MRSLSFALSVALITALSAMPANAADCEAAKTPIEHLLCGDLELSRLDARLTRALGKHRERRDKGFQQRQNGWLADRLKQCGIPAKGEAPDKAQAWRWAPCLAGLYRARLRELGDAAADPRLPADAAFIHPLCLWEAVLRHTSQDTVEDPAVDLAACTRAKSHVAATPAKGHGWYRDGWTAAGNERDNDVTVTAWPVASLEGQAYRLFYDYKDSGAEAEVVVIARSGGSIAIDYRIDGTSGFNEGAFDDAILQLKVHPGPRIEVERRVTPYGLIGFSSASGWEHTGILCPDCPYGTLRQEYSPEARHGRVLSATLTAAGKNGKASLPSSGDKASHQQACFDKVFIDRKAKAPITLSAEQYAALVARFIKECPYDGN